MTPRTNELLPELLALPEADREELVERLVESLDGPADPDAVGMAPDADGPADPDYDAAWSDEIARRLADYRAGRVTPIPWEDVRRRLTAELNDDAG